ncbi:hypothetical protein Trydic_g6537 [Trypoxylus dichotomus]
MMTSYVKNADHFIDITRQQHVKSTDMLTSFDVTSLLIQIPINETVHIIGNKHLEEDHLINLIEHCLKNTYFTYNRQRYRQTGTPVGSQLSPIIVNIFMKDFDTLKAWHVLHRDSVSSTSMVFLDETWIYSKGNKIRSWQDDTIESVHKPEGYDGKRFMVAYTRSEQGFINRASLIFASNSKTADYHSAMDSRKSVTKQLIPNLPPNSLVVMDNARYHSVVTNKIPNTLSRKQDIMD